jgi:hypothetical protein
MLSKWIKVIRLLPLVLLTACSTTQEQPDPYALPEYAEPDSLCRDISGSYMAQPHPLAEAEQEPRPLLAQTLLAATVRLDNASRVELKMTEAGVMHVLAYDSNGALLAKQQHTEESGAIECDEGQLKFYPPQLNGVAKGIGWDKVVLRKTADGSLMLRKGGLFSGLIFMVVPVAVSTEDWYLFKPAR